MKVILLEDDDVQAAQLTRYLHDFQEETKTVSFLVTRYARAIALLEDYSCDADLLFLDIRLPDMDGMETARRIRQVDENVAILFITSLSQYTIEGYSVGALDYILKPVAYASFRAKMERVLRLCAHREPGAVLWLKSRNGQRRVSASEILYLESASHDISIHAVDGSVIKQWGTLTDFESQLAGDHFVRCNSCYLVNLKYVQGINGSEVLLPGVALAVSRPRRKEFLQAFAQYKGGSC